MGIERTKRVTLRDVARHANVSTAVVSYVINNGPRATSPATRQRVLQAIEELNYHPSAFARGLRAQQTYTIGFIANDYNPLDVFVSSYSNNILTGVTTQLKAQDYYVLIYPMVIDEDVASLERLLRSGRLDGMIVRLIQDSPATDSLMAAITATKIPCVTIERPCHSRFNVRSVTYDDAQGATDATHFLLERGHRRIAHLRGDLRYASVQARQAGYRQALQEWGVPADEHLILGDSWDSHDAADRMRQLLALAEPPTAVFAASDNLARAAIDVLQEHGVKVPNAMAIIGFDDIPLAQRTIPPLTTVRIPLVELGQRAAELVLQVIAGNPQAHSEMLPVQLIERASA